MVAAAAAAAEVDEIAGCEPVQSAVQVVVSVGGVVMLGGVGRELMRVMRCAAHLQV